MILNISLKKLKLTNYQKIHSFFQQQKKIKNKNKTDQKKKRKHNEKCHVQGSKTLNEAGREV